MSEITIIKLSEEEFAERKISSWPLETIEKSRFERIFESEESFYMLEGDLWIDTPTMIYHIFPGDLITFPKGLKCTWAIWKRVGMHHHIGS
jgi:uncharacterized protein